MAVEESRTETGGHRFQGTTDWAVGEQGAQSAAHRRRPAATSSRSPWRAGDVGRSGGHEALALQTMRTGESSNTRSIQWCNRSWTHFSLASTQRRRNESFAPDEVVVGSWSHQIWPVGMRFLRTTRSPALGGFRKDCWLVRSFEHKSLFSLSLPSGRERGWTQRQENSADRFDRCLVQSASQAREAGWILSAGGLEERWANVPQKEL
ncbi:hypothetical protein RJ55_07280 [Drechmeria coniospora]|nr:hypothetical protein RJ55_07280 [Drechmeria coniospora]